MTRPEPSSDDLKHWRALIRQAEAAADNIHAPMGDLDRAAARARKAIMPGEISTANAFYRLQTAAWGFVRQSKTDRLQSAAALAELAAVCRRALGEITAPPLRKPPVLTGRRPFYLEPEEE